MHDVEYFLNSDARVPEYQEYLKDHEACRVFLENELAHLSKEDLERIIHNPIRGNLSQEGLACSDVSCGAYDCRAATAYQDLCSEYSDNYSGSGQYPESSYRR